MQSAIGGLAWVGRVQDAAQLGLWVGGMFLAFAGLCLVVAVCRWRGRREPRVLTGTVGE